MSKRFRVILSFVLLAVVLFTALPKVYLHQLMGHRHVIEQNHSVDGSDSYTSDSNTQNCELEKFETPVYFTIFKFILKCAPFRHTTTPVSYHYEQEFPVNRKTDTTSLRGPPAV